MKERRRNRYRRGGRRPSGVRIALILLGLAVVYAGILLGVRAVGNRLEGQDAVEAVGSLEGRFDSDILTTQYANRTWTYRKRDLTNILLLGVDWTETEDAVSGRYAGQADFLYLITLDKKNRTILTLQLDRDTITDIRIFGPFGDYTGIRTTQLCLSHAYGDTLEQNNENTVWAVERLLGGIPVDACVALDMGAIDALNEALGGVTVTLEEDFSRLDAQMTKGATVTLRGEQAELFVRGRMNVGDGKNASRMRRQRAFIQAATEKIAQGLNEDVEFADRLFDALSAHMTADVERGWLINKAYESRAYRRSNTMTLAGDYAVGEDGFMEFHADEGSLSELLAANYFE